MTVLCLYHLVSVNLIRMTWSWAFRVDFIIALFCSHRSTGNLSTLLLPPNILLPRKNKLAINFLPCFLKYFGGKLHKPQNPQVYGSWCNRRYFRSCWVVLALSPPVVCLRDHDLSATNDAADLGNPYVCEVSSCTWDWCPKPPRTLTYTYDAFASMAGVWIQVPASG